MSSFFGTLIYTIITQCQQILKYTSRDGYTPYHINIIMAGLGYILEGAYPVNLQTPNEGKAGQF